MDGVVEQLRVLRHQSDPPAQRAQVGRAEVHALDQDNAAVGIVKARQQAEQRRLAAAIAADNGDHLPGLHSQADVVERGVSALSGL